MNNGKNPYEILGVPRSSTLAQIKTRYFELARKHHPDKLDPHTSEEDKKKHEEIFKEITNAYSRINKEKEFQNKFGTSETCDFMDEDMKNEDWRSVWADLESFFNKPDSWERMKNIVTDTIKDTLYEATMYSIYKSTNTWKDSSRDSSRDSAKKQHYITVDVTLEEVHLKKQKKLRLFLKGIQMPIFLTLDIGEYPQTTMTHEIENKIVVIDFTMNLLEHSVYRMDTILDTWDLWALKPIKITWNDYLCGKTFTYDYIDGSKINIIIDQFNINSPYCLIDKGLCGLGNLYFPIELECPKEINKNKWNSLDKKFKTVFLRQLDELYI